MFQQLTTKSGSYNDLLDLEEAIRVEEEDLQRHCCCFRHTSKQSREDHYPTQIVRYYKRASLSVTHEDVITKEVDSESDINKMLRPLLGDHRNDSECDEGKVGSTNNDESKVDKHISEVEVTHQHISIDDVGKASESDEEDIDKIFETCRNSIKSTKKCPVIPIERPSIKVVTTNKSDEDDSDISTTLCSPSFSDQGSSKHFDHHNPFQTSPRTNRSQSLKISTENSKRLSSNFLSHPSSPVRTPRSSSCYYSSQVLPQSPTERLAPPHPTQCNLIAVSQPQFQPTQFLTSYYNHSFLNRKPSNTSIISECSTLSSTATAATISAPSTRLFPTTELPPVGRMRRVFTSHVRRRRKKKPSAISFHLTNLMKEPLRVVHSVPLSFPPG